MGIIFGLIIAFLAMSIAGKIIYDTRGVCYFGPTVTSDNEKIVRSASQICLFDWPSKMHSIPGNRSQLREYWTLFIHVLGRFKKDNSSDHMNITLALLANAVSSILAYFVFSIYFNPTIGFVVALLYITSFWPYHVAIYMGHVHLAQMFFLSAIIFLQTTEMVDIGSAYILFLCGGLFTAVSFFSSSASRKYPPVVLIALVYALREHIILPWSDAYDLGNLWMIISIIILVIFVNVSTRLFLERIVTFLNKVIKSVMWKKDHVVFLNKQVSRLLILVGLISIFFNLADTFIIPFALYALGIVIVSIHILFPPSELRNNLSRYYGWLNVSKWASHFKSYPEKKKTFGRELPDDFRGGGLIWNHRFFLIVMPLVYPLYIFSVLFLGFNAVDAALESCSVGLVAIFILFVITSLMPIIIHEATKGLKVGKAYMPALLLLLLVTAGALNQLLSYLGSSPILNRILWEILSLIIVAQFAHTIYVLFSDTIPCRMAPTILRNKLKEFKVKEFYTYDNPYNDSFVHTMVYSYPNEFKVHTINSISEVNNGIVVIPNTSSKSVNSETMQYAILNGDFDKDEALNELYENRGIEKIALAKIRTMGSSKYYVHESEVTSYRDLILKQMADQDRWRGNAWIFHSGTVANKIN